MEPFISTGSCTFTDSIGLETGTLWSQPAPKSLNYANLAQNCSTISGYQFFTSAWYVSVHSISNQLRNTSNEVIRITCKMVTLAIQLWPSQIR